MSRRVGGRGQGAILDDVLSRYDRLMGSEVACSNRGRMHYKKSRAPLVDTTDSTAPFTYDNKANR